MYTRCPKCHTCFRITDRLLAMANGKVRCGKCSTVFNARDHAVDQIPEQQAAPASQPSAVSKPAAPQASPKPVSQPAQSAPPAARSSTPGQPVQHDRTMVFDSASPAMDNMETIIEPAPLPGNDETQLVDADATQMVSEEDLSLSGLIKPGAIDNGFSSSLDDTVIPEDDDSFAVEEADTYHQIKPASNQSAMTPNNLQTMLPFDIDTEDEDDVESIVLDSSNEFISLDDDLHGEDDPFGSQDPFSDEDPFTDDDPFADDDLQVEKRLLADLEKSRHDREQKKDIESEFNEASLDDIFGDIDTEEASEEDIFGDVSDSQTDAVDDVPLALRNKLQQAQAAPRSMGKTLLMLFSILLLAALLALQVVVFRSSDVMAMVPKTRPWLETLCATLPCIYSGKRDVDKIDLISRDVRLHPRHKDILLISAAMKNAASFDQPYPDIELVLSDISGNIIAQRRFTPKEYMGSLSSPFLLMKRNRPVHVKLEVVDPGKDAVNFEFTFR